MAVFDALNYNSEVFRAYITWSGILIIKMMMMGFLTGLQRFRKGAFENPEDLRPGAEIVIKKDEDVERVRRAHLNDLENVLPFFVAGFLYVCTEPNVDVGLNLIRVAAIARILHTIVYAIYPIRQPARTICFFVCLIITVYMAVASIVHFFKV